MAGRHLDAIGKGEFNYSYDDDLLIFSIKNRNYKKSVDFDDISIDIDDDNFITGLRIFDASKLLNIPKMYLRNIKSFEMNAESKGDQIIIKLTFYYTRRNKIMMSHGQNIQLSDKYITPQGVKTSAVA